MPASRSTNPNTKPLGPPGRAHARWPFWAIGIIAALAVLVTAMPASVIGRFLPPGVRAADFTGTIWHGSTEALTVNGRNAGAFEWQLEPAALLQLKLELRAHWALAHFQADAVADTDGHRIALHGLRGGGPIEDLSTLGVPAGWQGVADIAIDELAIDGLSGDATRLTAAGGDVKVSNLSSAEVAAGSNLGGYLLRFAPGAVDPTGAITGNLSDTGGPLEVRGTITLSPAQHSGLISGTILERDGAPPELRKNLENLARMRGRDRQGRIPVDLEFTF